MQDDKQKSQTKDFLGYKNWDDLQGKVFADYFGQTEKIERSPVGKLIYWLIGRITIIATFSFLFSLLLYFLFFRGDDKASLFGIFVDTTLIVLVLYLLSSLFEKAEIIYHKYTKRDLLIILVIITVIGSVLRRLFL